MSDRAPTGSTGASDGDEPAPSTGPVPVAAVPLEVGQGIGPIRLGMARSQLEALGMAVDESGNGLRVGPYRLLMTDGLVSFIEVELANLADGLRIADQHVPASARDIESIAKRLPDCGKVDIRLGGNVIECAGGTVTVAAAGPPGIVQVQLMTEAHAARLRPANVERTVPRPSAGPPCAGGGPCGK